MVMVGSCSFGTEFDSPFEMYMVHVWQMLYRVCAVLVYRVGTKLTQLLKLWFKSVSIFCRLQVAVCSLKFAGCRLQLASCSLEARLVVCCLQFAVCSVNCSVSSSSLLV